MLDKVLTVEWIVTHMDDLERKYHNKLHNETGSALYFKGGSDTLQKLREKILEGQFDCISNDDTVG